MFTTSALTILRTSVNGLRLIGEIGCALVLRHDADTSASVSGGAAFI